MDRSRYDYRPSRKDDNSSSSFGSLSKSVLYLYVAIIGMIMPVVIYLRADNSPNIDNFSGQLSVNILLTATVLVNLNYLYFLWSKSARQKAKEDKAFSYIERYNSLPYKESIKIFIRVREEKYVIENIKEDLNLRVEVIYYLNFLEEVCYSIYSSYSDERIMKNFFFEIVTDSYRGLRRYVTYRKTDSNRESTLYEYFEKVAEKWVREE